MSTKAKVWLWVIGILMLLGLLFPHEHKDTPNTTTPTPHTVDDSGVPQDAKDTCAATAQENGNGVAEQERGLYIICIHAVKAQQDELSSIERNN